MPGDPHTHGPGKGQVMRDKTPNTILFFVSYKQYPPHILQSLTALSGDREGDTRLWLLLQASQQEQGGLKPGNHVPWDGPV